MATFKARGKISIKKSSKRKTKRSSGKKSLRFAKAVQSVINKNAEDKMAYKSVVNISYNSGIDSQTDLNSLVPQLTQSATDNGRNGDQIRGKKLNISGFILSNLTYNTYSACRIGVRVMIVQPKGYLGYDPAYNSAVTWLATLLKKGGTVSGFTGTVQDFLAPINTDTITKYYDRKFYVKSPFMYSSVGNAETTGSTKFFNINLPMRNKLLRYDSTSNSGLTPVNYNPWLIVGYCHLDSSTPDTVTTQINLNFTSTLMYQDM